MHRQLKSRYSLSFSLSGSGQVYSTLSFGMRRMANGRHKGYLHLLYLLSICPEQRRSKWKAAKWPRAVYPFSCMRENLLDLVILLWGNKKAIRLFCSLETASFSAQLMAKQQSSFQQPAAHSFGPHRTNPIELVIIIIIITIGQSADTQMRFGRTFNSPVS